MTILAAFFVLYAVLDISVLQAYCGNEALGIPPWAAQLKLESNDSPFEIGTGGEAYVIFSQIPDDERSNHIPASDEACFCCCSHTTIAIGFLNPVKQPAALPVSAPNYSKKNLHADAHPLRFYQPPKFS